MSFGWNFSSWNYNRFFFFWLAVLLSRPHFAISKVKTNFFYLSEILPSWIRNKKKKWGVCCKTLSGIPPANAPLLLSPQAETESFAFGMGIVCILQLGKAHLFLNSGRQRQPKEWLAWLHCKEMLAWAPTDCCDYPCQEENVFYLQRAGKLQNVSENRWLPCEFTLYRVQQAVSCWKSPCKFSLSCWLPPLPSYLPDWG